ncbi:MAG: tetratricopeptide repeat protein [Fimbriiglobus sp.]|nr:tetratricopeptide repeat protein [Fimbriiglobus sp.]
MTRFALPILLFAAPIFAQTKPTTPPPEVEQALEALKANKVTEALDKLASAAKTNTQLPPPKVQLAQWLFQMGNGPAARTFIEQALAEDPKHPEGYLLNANFAFGEGRMTDAFLSLRLALDLTADPRWDADQKKRFAREARSGLVEVCFTRGDFAAAKEYALELLNADPKSGATRARLATVVFRQDKPAEAEKEYTQAFADDPTLDPPELQLAGQWQLRATSEADPAKKSAATDKTEEWLKKAVSAHPKNPKPAREYGLWLLSAGKLNAAGPYIDAAHALDPNGKETAVARAVWLLNKKDATAAEPILEGVYKDSPADLNALSLLCLCLSESSDDKKKKRAVELADTLVRQNPKGAAGYAVLGWCLYKGGRKDDAERALATALNSGQINSDAAYFAARLLVDKQKYEDAHKLLVGATGVKQGMFIYRSDADALLAEVAKKLPEKKEK